MMNATQQNSEKLLKTYFQLSSTIFSSQSPQEIAEIKNRLWEIRKEMKSQDFEDKR